ncbi:hypothetical protein QYE76_045667 [Lolium multiflorum]|uniref:Uncharacterized protein n=1 Tax=Lolium multiflorum TaxID=4521 RepID=A0AAD8TKU1_LOLMU|nr:hypothetical protein QYE76_045667 [Lolium multiflorum]
MRAHCLLMIVEVSPLSQPQPRPPFSSPRLAAFLTVCRPVAPVRSTAPPTPPRRPPSAFVYRGRPAAAVLAPVAPLRSLFACRSPLPRRSSRRATAGRFATASRSRFRPPAASLARGAWRVAIRLGATRSRSRLKKAMSYSSDYVAIPRCLVTFDGANYPNFAAFMRVHMRGLRLWGVLSGEEVKDAAKSVDDTALAEYDRKVQEHSTAVATYRLDLTDYTQWIDEDAQRVFEFLSRLRKEFELRRAKLLARGRVPLSEVLAELRAEETHLLEVPSVLAARGPLVPSARGWFFRSSVVALSDRTLSRGLRGLARYRLFLDGYHWFCASALRHHATTTFYS